MVTQQVKNQVKNSYNNLKRAAKAKQREQWRRNKLASQFSCSSSQESQSDSLFNDSSQSSQGSSRVSFANPLVQTIEPTATVSTPPATEDLDDIVFTQQPADR